jgi:hypothetical protein
LPSPHHPSLTKQVCSDKCSTGGRAFSRNATDTFLLKGQTDVGRMNQIEISHDDTGVGAGRSGVHSRAWGQVGAGSTHGMPSL